MTHAIEPCATVGRSRARIVVTALHQLHLQKVLQFDTFLAKCFLHLLPTEVGTVLALLYNRVQSVYKLLVAALTHSSSKYGLQLDQFFLFNLKTKLLLPFLFLLILFPLKQSNTGHLLRRYMSSQFMSITRGA